jgi:hypothetical protein
MENPSIKSTTQMREQIDTTPKKKKKQTNKQTNKSKQSSKIR